MTVDCTTYNGEEWAFDLRYNILKGVVDEFVVVEFDTTFSGEPKQPTFPTEKYPDVTYCFHDETVYGKYAELAESSPNTKGAQHWKREFMQKESIQDALQHLKDDDVVFIGDVDEIWSPTLGTPRFPVKLKLRVYTYWLNNRSTEEFWGTVAAKWIDIKYECLNHLRTTSPGTDGYGGWHFTSMGGADSLRKKLTDSYTQESYATPEILENIAYNIEQNKDFLGRDFSYTVDESEWPEFLRRNRQKYEYLCLNQKNREHEDTRQKQGIHAGVSGKEQGESEANTLEIETQKPRP